MVKLSELKRICASREADLTDEERAARDKYHAATLAMFDRIQARTFPYLTAIERALVPLRAMDLALAPMQARMLALSAPTQQLADAISHGPAGVLARAVSDSPVARLARAPEDMAAALVLRPSVHPDGLAWSGRVREIRRSCFECGPALLSTVPSRVEARDTRQDQILEEVKGLRSDLRAASASAAAEAERGRQAAVKRERRQTLLQWLLAIVKAVLSWIPGAWTHIR